MQFTSLPQEETNGPSPPADWPQKARVVFKDLTLRYDKDADPVLKKLNIEIESGWKVSIDMIILKNYYLILLIEYSVIL